MTLTSVALLWDEWNDNAYCVSDSMTPKQMEEAESVIQALSSEDYGAMMGIVREMDRRKRAHIKRVSEALIRFDDAIAKKASKK